MQIRVRTRRSSHHDLRVKHRGGFWKLLIWAHDDTRSDAAQIPFGPLEDLFRSTFDVANLVGANRVAICIESLAWSLGRRQHRRADGDGARDLEQGATHGARLPESVVAD